MPASYPTSIKTWADKQDFVDDAFSSDTNGAYAEIIAVETELISNVHKQPVRVATTANITLSGAQTIDGAAAVAGNRVLVKDQTTASQNGIYVVAAGAWSRAVDADAAAKIKTGMSVYVTEGTVNAGGIWSLSTTGSIVVGTTALIFINKFNAHTADTVHKQVNNVSQPGLYSNAEGDNTTAKTDCSHAEGRYTLACNGTLYNITAFDNTAKTITLDKVTGLIVGDLLTIKINNLKAIEDIPITVINGLIVTLDTTATITLSWAKAIEKAATIYAVHTEGNNTTASGMLSHAEGNGTIASGNTSHAEGDNTTASGMLSHAEGSSTIASGNTSHAEGANTTASGMLSHAEGYHTTASGDTSHAEGDNTTASVYDSHTMGQYNKALAGSVSSYIATADAFIIGNGTAAGALGNAFRVTFDGKVYGLSAFNSTGADYAEFFEWLDQNIDSEDRVGYFTTLDGEKIRKANSTDDYILGIVSANPSVIGDSYNDDWNGKYVTDDWGRIQYHDVLVPATDDKPEHTEYQPIYNPLWDSSLEYIPREQRKEWSPVGIMGKLFVRDDGTCVVNSYCKSNDGGIAITSTSGYRVVKRVADNIVQVLLK